MTTTTADATTDLPRPTSLQDVKGWFLAIDQQLFRWFLTRQNELGERGDLLELGTYMGKSSIFMGAHLGEGETFTVCDLFDSEAADDANSAETGKSYSTLTRRAFEANYLSFHDELPVVIQGPTSIIGSKVAPGSCRFAHIDASHLYEHVRGDIETVRDLLLPKGIVALDDYRAEHTPGVAAAAWEAVAVLGLRVVCVTGSKFYGTWGDPGLVRRDLLEWLDGRTDMWHEVQQVAGQDMIRISNKNRKTPFPPHPASRHEAPEPAPSVAAEQTPTAGTRPRRRPSRARRLAKDLLPPVVTRAIIARRRAR